MGGQVGLADHIAVGDGVKIGAKSGLHKDVPAGAAMFGYPALERSAAFKMVASMRRIPELIQRIRRLEQQRGAVDGTEVD
jgi:UDP-3-O-[3-hydroxymyristoyl] glucosamine N-acyltransferase